MNPDDYPVIGHLVMSDDRRLTVTPPTDTRRRGVLLLMEVTPTSKHLRFAASGSLFLILGRAHPKIKSALERGAQVEVRFKDNEDDMDAAFTAHEYITRRGLAWNTKGDT